MMIIIYLMILPITLFGLETDNKMNSRNDTNSKSYVPKKKRGYGYRLKRWLNSRANEVYRWVIERSEMIKIKRKVRKRKHVAKRMNMPDSQPKREEKRAETHNLISRSSNARWTTRKVTGKAAKKCRI